MTNSTNLSNPSYPYFPTASDGSMPQIEVRIIKDPANRDGWISKALKDDKIGFISNLSAFIPHLEAGQVYSAEIIQIGPNYQHIKLLVRHS